MERWFSCAGGADARGVEGVVCLAALAAKRPLGQWVVNILFVTWRRRAPQLHEEMLETITHNPTTDVYATGGDWVHAIELRGANRLLFISGTMGLRPDFTAPPTLEEQLVCVWDNLRTILASAGMTTANLVRLTSYLRDPSYAEANAAARLAALGSRRIPTTAIVVQTLSEDWLIELEAIAAD